MKLSTKSMSEKQDSVQEYHSLIDNVSVGVEQGIPFQRGLKVVQRLHRNTTVALHQWQAQ